MFYFVQESVKGLSSVIVLAFLSHCLSPSKLTHQMNDEVCEQKHHHHLEIPGERATGQEALQFSNLSTILITMLLTVQPPQ